MMPDRRQSFRTAPALTPPDKERVRRINDALLRWGPVRNFPWRKKKVDRFHVLVTESLLTRTRAEAVAAVIEELWRRFPAPNDLASASAEDVATVVATLGLKKRAQMLRACARAVVEAGDVPNDRAALLQMSGVGEYVADAVRVFAFGEAVIPVDAVIGRVLRRVLGYQSYGPAYADRALWRIAQLFSLTHDPKLVTSALLDLGALICLPEKPKCPLCPLREECAYGMARFSGALPD
jgi:A/G-specific adenine glycosylase